jgi:hypothetical protein
MDIEIIIPGHGTTCDKSIIDIEINYWNCLVSETQKMIEAGKDLEFMLNTLSESCHIPGIPVNEMKHKRNVDSVVSIIRNRFGG